TFTSSLSSSHYVSLLSSCSPFFFFHDPATSEIYTLSLHDALPISRGVGPDKPQHLARRQRKAQIADLEGWPPVGALGVGERDARSEEHTSELQSRVDLVCRLLLEKKKKKQIKNKECLNKKIQ